MTRPLSSGRLIPLVLVVLLLPGCDSSDDAAAESPLAPTTTTAPTPTAMESDKTTSGLELKAADASIDAREVLEPASWNRLLAETKARLAPPPATCPTFSIPEAGDRARSRIFPYDGGRSSRAVFDQNAGRVIYHDHERTWAFDVCTNTWTRLQDHDMWKPTGWLGTPVYDVDSAKIVSFGYVINVFDAATGSWTEHTHPNDWDGINGAVYDPVSGLIVAISQGNHRLLTAYDAETDTWTEIGIVPAPSERDSLELLGYSPALDRFILTVAESGVWPTPPVDPPGVTLLVDPRTGMTSVVSTPSPGYPFNLREGHYRYGAFWQTAGSVIVDRHGFPLCGFSAQTLTWDTCYALPDETPRQAAAFEPNIIVEDTINDRLLFLTFRDYYLPDGLWAHDQATNQWTHVPFVISK